jgi:acyl dehydratase
MAERAIESLDELKSWIGKEAGVSGWVAITQERINQFAALSEDQQWIHVDVERARQESPFGVTVAHGFLTVSLLTMLVADAVEIRVPSKLLVNYGFNRLRFPAPVPAGARIRARVTLQSVEEIGGGVQMAWQVVVEIENQVKPALAAEWLLRMYF